MEDMSRDLFDDDIPDPDDSEEITVSPDTWQIPETDNEEDCVGSLMGWPPT